VTRYVVDASAAIAFVLRERNRAADQFWRSLDPADELVGAQLFLPECTSVIRRQVFRANLTAAEGESALQDLLGFRVSLNLDERQFTRSLELAHRMQRARAYDMQYLAVAEMEDVELVTADGGLHEAALELGHPVRFLR